MTKKRHTAARSSVTAATPATHQVSHAKRRRRVTARAELEAREEATGTPSPKRVPVASSLPRPTWQTADHSIVLYHADAREILPRLAAKSIDFIFTDPPYGHNNNDGDLIHRWEAALGRRLPSGPPASRPIANDGAEADPLVRWFFGEAARILRCCCCCCCCCCGGGGPDPQFARWCLWLDEVLDFKQMVIWDKGPMGMGWHYRRSYETVLVAQNGGASCRWYDDTHRVENVIRPAQGIRKIIPGPNEHPTAKPPELAAKFIRLHTLPGHLVLDPFAGAGSTAAACVREGRRFIGIECDRAHFDAMVATVKAERRAQRRRDRLIANCKLGACHVA